MADFWDNYDWVWSSPSNSGGSSSGGSTPSPGNVPFDRDALYEYFQSVTGGNDPYFSSKSAISSHPNAPEMYPGSSHSDWEQKNPEWIKWMNFLMGGGDPSLYGQDGGSGGGGSTPAPTPATPPSSAAEGLAQLYAPAPAPNWPASVPSPWGQPAQIQPVSAPTIPPSGSGNIPWLQNADLFSAGPVMQPQSSGQAQTPQGVGALQSLSQLLGGG